MPTTLLLADDSVTIRMVVGISFANEDVTLVTVDNGDDALARAREIRPDIVLADVVMPGMNGYEVCEAIKSDPQLRHTPVLLLTGTFEAFDEGRAARAGADGHITKPFEARALVEQVNARLAQAAAPEPAPISESPTPRPAKLALEDALELGSAPAVSLERGSSFDFFDDEVTAPRSGSAPRPNEETMVVAGDLEVGGQEEDAFAFESTDDLDEELSAAFRASPEPQREVPTATLEMMGEPDLTPERTAAFVPDDDAFTSALTEPPDQAPALGESDLAGLEPDQPFAIQAAASLQDFTSSLPDAPAPTASSRRRRPRRHLDRMRRPLSASRRDPDLSDLDDDPGRGGPATPGRRGGGRRPSR
jgi:CheY-like chemotaxis protein